MSATFKAIAWLLGHWDHVKKCSEKSHELARSLLKKKKKKEKRKKKGINRVQKNKNKKNLFPAPSNFAYNTKVQCPVNKMSIQFCILKIKPLNNTAVEYFHIIYKLYHQPSGIL